MAAFKEEWTPLGTNLVFPDSQQLWRAANADCFLRISLAHTQASLGGSPLPPFASGFSPQNPACTQARTKLFLVLLDWAPASALETQPGSVWVPVLQSCKPRFREVICPRQGQTSPRAWNSVHLVNLLS